MLQALPQCARRCHHQAGWCPWTKENPSSGCSPMPLRTLRGPGPSPSPLAPGTGPAPQSMAEARVRHASCAKVDEQIRANTLGGSWHAWPCPLLPEPGCPHSALTNPSLPHQSLLPLGWADSWASACGSPGYKRQAGDRSTEFFKALMEPAS